MADIFTPIKIGSLTLKNRIIRSGCFEGMCRNQFPQQELLDHHHGVAEGGAAMTTVAYCAVSRDGLAFKHEMYMRDEILDILSSLTDLVHKENCKASIQLGHCGFFASPFVIKKRPLGPSAKFCTFRMSLSREMSLDDVTRIKDDYTSSALLAQKAGFDAVEIHAGHGYLLSQFLSSWTNKRLDEYGGSIHKRLRFPAEVIKKVKGAVGDKTAVIVKMNVSDGFKGGLTPEEAVLAARAFEDAGADALVPSSGFTARTPFHMMRGDIPFKEFSASESNYLKKIFLYLFGGLAVKRYPFDELFLFDDALRIVRAVKIPVLLIGGVCSRQNIEKALASGFAGVQAGRAFIRDPDFVKRLKSGEIQKTDCDHCNKCVGTISGGPVKCLMD